VGRLGELAFSIAEQKGQLRDFGIGDGEVGAAIVIEVGDFDAVGAFADMDGL
jgi:hypothetical protein